jgi:hypothetical protein
MLKFLTSGMLAESFLLNYEDGTQVENVFSTWCDELLPGEDEPDGLFCQFDDGAELEHLVPILIHKVQHLDT